jgi:hypothetical protein
MALEPCLAKKTHQDYALLEKIVGKSTYLLWFRKGLATNIDEILAWPGDFYENFCWSY